jgi:YVTN family beta-propeller protein/VCBS repeat-containing protein
MGYAKHVGRVGALAVALGIGAAVATTPGVAWADGETDTKVEAPSNTEPPGDQGTADTTTSSTDPGEVIRRNIERAADDLRDGIRKVVTGVVRSSGGAITSTHRNGSNQNNGNVPPVVIEDEEEPIENPEAPKDEAKPTPFVAKNNAASVLQSFAPPRWRASQAQVTAKPLPKAIDDAKDAVQQSINTVTGNESPSGSTAVGRNAFSTLDSVETEDQQQARPSFVAPVAIITNVLNAALAPFLNPTPGQPAPQNPVLWAVLGWVRRQVQDTPFGKVVLNRPPQMQGVLVTDQGGGKFLIKPIATDADGDDLTYTITPTGSNDQATIADNGNGTYTYQVSNPGSWDKLDTVTVTVSDEADYPHLHGLFGLFNPGGGHTASIQGVEIKPNQPTGPVVNEGIVSNYEIGRVDLTKAENVADALQLDGSTLTLPSGGTATLHFDAGTGALTADVNPSDANRLASFFNPQPSPVSAFSSMRMASFAAAAVAPTYDGFEHVSVTVGDQTFDVAVPITAARLQAGAPITVGQAPAAMAASGNHVYVLNANPAANPGDDPNAGTVSVINTTTNQVEETITVGRGATSIVASGDRVYVVNSADRTITVINALDNTVVDTNLTTPGVVDPIALDPDRRPIPTQFNIAASEDGKRLYIVNSSDGTLSVVSTETNALVDVVPSAPGSDADDPERDIDPLIVGGFGNVSAAVSGKRLYVVDQSAESVKVFNIDEQDQQQGPTDVDSFGQQVGDPISVGNIPGSIGVVSPPGATAPEVWVVNQFDGTISVIDTSTNEVTTTIRLPSSLAGNVVFSPDDSLAYVSTADQVAVIDTARHQLLLTTATDDVPEGYPEFVQVSADGSRIYASRFVSELNFSSPVWDNTVMPISFVTGGTNTGPVANANIPGQTTNPDTGVVTTILTVDDDDNDALSVTVTPGASGTATAAPGANGTYTITYTPTGQARLEAFDTAGDQTDTVTVIVTDGLEATSVEIPVTVVPAAAAITDTYEAPSGLHLARGLAVGPNGNVYVTFTTVEDEETFRVTLWNAATQSFVDDAGHVSQSGSGSLADDVAVDGQGRVYVVNRTTSSVDVYDNGVATPVDVGFGGVPVGLFTGSDGDVYAVVHEIYDPTPDDQMILDNRLRTSIYNVTDDNVAVAEAYTTSNTGGFGDPFSKGVARSAGRFYVINPSENSVVDTANPSNPIELDGRPISIAYDDVNDRVYVTESRPNAADPSAYDLVLVDVTSGSRDEVGVVYTVPSSPGEQTTLESDMVVSPDGGHVYVTNTADATVTVVNAQSGVVEHTISIPEDIVGRGAPYRIAFSPEGDRVYVVDAQGKVSQISFADSAIEA